MIARAVLLEPAIMLLDDPTAAIDSETEHEIFAALDRAIAGRTTFIVAHRLSTLRRADFIIVLEGVNFETGKADILPQFDTVAELRWGAQIAARLEQGQGGEQLLVVGGVQADGRLVQNVKDAAEIGTQLGGQADALGFAARKGG